ncbi:oxidoreductase C-terminal domain-containing protein [Streptomyces sp. NPDC002523]
MQNQAAHRELNPLALFTRRHAAQPQRRHPAVLNRPPSMPVRTGTGPRRASLLGTGPESIRFHTQCPDCGGPHGKPHVVGPGAGWELAISHSGDVVAVPIAAGRPLGLDVEKPEPRKGPGLPPEYELGHTHDTEPTLVGDDPGSSSVLLFLDDDLIAVESVNRPADHMAARRLLAAGIPLTPAQAADPGFTLRAHLKTHTAPRVPAAP